MPIFRLKMKMKASSSYFYATLGNFARLNATFGPRVGRLYLTKEGLKMHKQHANLFILYW